VVFASGFFAAIFRADAVAVRVVLGRAGLRTAAARRVAVRVTAGLLVRLAVTLTLAAALTFAFACVFAFVTRGAPTIPFPARTTLRAFTTGRRVGLLREVEAIWTTLGMVVSWEPANYRLHERDRTRYPATAWIPGSNIASQIGPVKAARHTDNRRRDDKLLDYRNFHLPRRWHAGNVKQGCVPRLPRNSPPR
jgi:hypothetical protein